MLVNTPTYGQYRDKPVHHVRTIYDTQSPLSVQYKCTCGVVLWSSNDDAIEEFLTNHQPCGEQ